MTRKQRTELLLQSADQRILVLDGATGTALQNMNLTADDFGGPELEGCNENLVLTRPEVVARVHEMYLEAGCDIIETNTFGATPLVLAEYDLSSKAYEINFKASQIARKAAEKFSTPEKTRFVAGSIGPTTKAISVTGGVTFDELIENFYQQAAALFDGGSDYFLIETCQDSRNIKAAMIGIDKVFKEKGEAIPVAISGTIENMGTMLAGQTIDALMASFTNRNLFYMGINCATGPEFMTDHIRTLAALASCRVACVPNAGLPDEDGKYRENPQMMSKVLEHFIEQGWLNMIGGCCGTTPEHIKAFSELAVGKTPREVSRIKRSNLSGVDYLEITNEMRPVIVGERTNSIGSRKFKELINDGKFEEASEIAKLQVKSGAQIIDICLANPDRDELADVIKFYDFVIKKIKAPIMIDSTDDEVIAKALTFCQGKAIINSINLEDGEERFEKVVPLAKEFGAALVIGTIDEDPLSGMAITRKRKLEVATRIVDLLQNKYNFPLEDVYFDPLVFPCASGDEQYTGSAVETIEGIRLIKEKYPQVKTVLGISNVSFGLPAAGREVLNSVFLYHCVQAGLDLAIVNAEKLERYASLPPDEIELAMNLLYNRGEDPIGNFAAKFRERKVKEKKDKNLIPLNERLASYIIEGTKEGLVDDLEEARKILKPLDIINGPLMKGMDEVGKLFNDNKLIVAEVLQSAEVMKASVNHLQKFMEKTDISTRGKIVLATVKGDVHDIGKNLVDIILSNNGFHVVNLGIKIPPEQLIQAIRTEKPDMIGLSGLLVKSAQQMVITADDLKRAGISLPILVGGAALSRNFTEKKILKAYDGAVIYASDAMNGLDLANKVMDKDGFAKINEHLNNVRRLSENLALETPEPVSAVPLRDPNLRSDNVKIFKRDEIPQPPDYNKHIDRQSSIEHIWKFINPLMLYTRHLGIKARIAKQFEKVSKDASVRKSLKEEDPRALEIYEAVEEVKNLYKNTPQMQPQGVHRFFRAKSEGNNLLVYPDNKLIAKPYCFSFERQIKPEFLCLSDYVSSNIEDYDNIAFFVTSVGNGVREEAGRLKDAGEFLKSHILQALAIESAEGFAEYMHSFLRSSWGFPDSPNTTMMDRFQAKYHGKRYSFGYPACPRLEDQTELFELLKPNDIGVQLTEGFMMDPEATVSAIVFHHPEAKYFGV
jgi:5-methyltetrahydrofolate--homocysteine methyltransferase